MEEWMRSGKYLPPVLRDFHDQKRIFQIVAEMVDRRRQRAATSFDRTLDDLPNWIAAHIYVIDFFLWFMALRGWTLQRSKRPFEFFDLDKDLAALDERKAEAFKAMIRSPEGDC